jgi:cell division protein FtsW
MAATRQATRERRVSEAPTPRLRPIARSAEPAAGAQGSSLLPAALAGVLGLLCIVGLVMVGSASSVVSIVYYESPWAIELREVLYMALGLVVFSFGTRLTVAALHRIARLGVFVALGALVLVMVPGFGASSNGAARWLGYGPFELQPSELAKFALCLYAAYVISRKERTEREWGRVLRPLAVVTIVGAGLVLAQPDMGTALVLVAIAFAVAAAAGAPWRAVSAALAGLGCLAVVAAVALPYRRERLLSFLNPTAAPSGMGYQELQSKIGFGTGHWVGLGLGNSREKWGLLPNPHTDFIFSILGEELGLVGTILVLTLLVGLVMLGLRVASHAPDRFSQLAAVGISAWLATETVMNVGAAVGVLPITGIPLPFISFGGTSLVIDMAAVGVLVSIARRSAASPKLTVVGQGSSARVRGRERTGRPARSR